MFYSDLLFDILSKKKLESSGDFAKSNFKKFKYDISAEHFEIITDQDVKYYHKEKGSYDLLSIPNVLYMTKQEISYCKKVLVDILHKYLRDIDCDSRILIVGLGNRHISADSLGTKVASSINIMLKGFGMPRVMAICPSVLGLTGIETSDIISGVVSKVKPTHIVLIDSLCASNPCRLGKSIQISNTGICPGSGIGNKRKCIDNTICKNIISIGVPLLIYAKTYLDSLLESKGINLICINSLMQSIKKQPVLDKLSVFLNSIKDIMKDDIDNEIVTIKDIEDCVEIISSIIGESINDVIGCFEN